ncbi:MAG: electron transfer flavoprotein subunit alpha/FixB family protein [Candidatus Hodarchaeales archaeon]
MNSEVTYEIVNLHKDVEGVFTFVEAHRGEIVQVSFEILAIARSLAEKLNTFVTAIHLGDNKTQLQEDCQVLFKYGADKVVLIHDHRLTHYSTPPYTHVIFETIKRLKPEIFLFGATTTGRDLAPRVAARCNAGLSADCTAFDIDDYTDKKNQKIYPSIANFIRPSFAEAKLATIIGNPKMWNYPQMGTVRPGTFVPLSQYSSTLNKIEFLDIDFIPDEFNIKIHESVRDSQDIVDFDNAKIIVSGGNGAGREAFNQLREIVDAINTNGQHAELGASRSAVEAGWASRQYQIGQTGRTVRPEYYVAVGISGAIQHIEGIKKAKRILAINNDPNAPIFNYADYGIIDDYKNVLPELLRSIKDGFIFPDVK